MNTAVAGFGCYLIVVGALLALSAALEERRRVDIWQARVDRLRHMRGGEP